MVKKIILIIYKILQFLDKIYFKFKNRKFLYWLNQFIQNNFYQEIKIFDQKVIFFTPNELCDWRVRTFYTKEPETLKWIDNFKLSNNIVFWDIGANIGLYSIYAALKHKEIEIYSFEPSTSNLRVLSRNISLNNLDKKIKIFQIPLHNKKNVFTNLNEEKFIEGGALNSFGVTYNFEGKEFNIGNKYSIYGTSINYLLDQNILSMPDYIKIDVDGIEHLILQGANNYLKQPKIKGVMIEINENFTDQLESVLSIMTNNNFMYSFKDQSSGTGDFSKTYNYFFNKI